MSYTEIKMPDAFAGKKSSNISDKPRPGSSASNIISSGIPSSAVHAPRTKLPATEDGFTDRTYQFAKNTIPTIIILLMLIMVGFTFFHLIATPEFLVKREVERITTDYYENYYYNAILDANSLDAAAVSTPEAAEPTMSEIMALYQYRGFARLTLRQLLLMDNRKHFASANSLAAYCDLDRTTIKIYPDPPFTRTDYHTDYTYSCEF